mmetsp:Transcript_58434/g.138989  ORF Transcript_58434/g.138989 Transcript_58434/m.138989 type:complete len:381 (-) Transcript_58434:69-1211(-)
MNFLNNLSSNLGLDSIGSQITSCFRLHSGACDVLIVRRSDGSLHSTSLLVHLGRDVPLSSLEDARVVLSINDKETDLVMFVDKESKCVLEGGGVLPPTELLASLPLKAGFNSATFLVQELAARKWHTKKEIPVGVFVWESSDRLVVMDVEGTVVRGDVWSKGADILLLANDKHQTAAGVGLENMRDGVAPLLTYLDRAGYRVLFLTAAPLTRAGRVRETLNWIRASERASFGRGAEVPASPVLTTSERMGTVLMRKLADKAVASVGGGATNQATFKAATLAHILTMFDEPSRREDTGSSGPFAGGLCDKPDDAKAYVDAGIPAENVFVLDAEGRVASFSPEHDDLVWASYVEMYGSLQKVFPKAPRLQRGDSSLETRREL